MGKPTVQPQEKNNTGKLKDVLVINRQWRFYQSWCSATFTRRGYVPMYMLYSVFVKKKKGLLETGEHTS
jgi:hypothetical protein